MSYNEIIRYLYSLQYHGIKFGLDNITRLLTELNNPQESFVSIHVAGTNGKGSTSAIIASIIRAAGFKVGLFTSPHLVSFTERIRINGTEITEDEVCRLAGEIQEIVSDIKDFSPTFFEVVTAMALLYFERNNVDIAVVEVGMGGRLDATNIIMPAVSVITNIGYDHKEFLGNTLAEIAHEKAGIIRNRIPVVVSDQEPEALEVIYGKAKEQNAELHIYGMDFSSILKAEDLSGIYFDYLSNSLNLSDLFLPLAGEHQMRNASVAIKAVTLLAEKAATMFTSDLIKEGLRNVKWPGRLEFIHEDPPIIIDGAHNPAAAAALSKTLRGLLPLKYGRLILILGIMDDKDIRGVMDPLLPLASEIILTSPSYSRSAAAEKLANIAASLGFHNVQTSPSVKKAIETSVEMVSGDKGGNSTAGITDLHPLILVTGSFYTIGEAKEALGRKGVLTRLRE